ncbi:two-component system nitrogen regulation response regulator GlnG/two-component system response regulator AtoC [Prosthecobacter fusiformis]|uniref:Two-component system nitrogen regulation response regulator GlnG/two-component system response regulator AtoC n=1 Tax=Prosthecobacter fusiformis TaxID=48464 RepID=A0A4R7RIT1_9BACT|nr:response regulator [Prosthecobacter fusiformis]TDU63218.1 two-component system nitrogen regulation response regulator GlnG/two-component system response regulator AtoC [Prosthecobacter fusiformis]
MARVLIIEDEYALAAALSTVVRRIGAEAVVAASGQGGLEKAQRQAFDAVLLDIGLPDMSGLKVLAALREAENPPPVMIITAHGTLDNALEARRLGAYDYFLKPLNLAEIQPQLQALLKLPRHEPPAVANSPDPVMMIGTAPAMQRAFAVIAQACATKVPVLLTGQPGTGKTLAAEVIAAQSGTQPLVRFRCDEWPREQAEVMLDGCLEKARGGPLLIEEVGALPLPLQAVVCRALAKEEQRILATSSHSLLEAVTQGRFREDLYYQLSVLHVSLPPLAERTEDLQALAAALLKRAAGERELPLALESLAVLKAYAWPGNVRELAAAMQHAAAVCSAPPVLPRHLPARLLENDQANVHLETALKRALVAWLDRQLTCPEEALPEYDALLAEVEKPLLAELLARFEDKPTRLAAALNMNRATLRRKLRELLGRE